jgi:DNA-binding PadR family transcriptional regulator
MSIKFAILGLLETFGPQSGYDIKSGFEQVPSHIWSADLPQIYRTLNRLETDELVSVLEDDNSARGRKIYTISETGRSELQAWLEEDFEPVTIRDPVLLRIFFGNKIPSPRLREQLASYREQLIALNSEYAEINTMLQGISNHQSDAFYWLMTLDLGLRANAVMIDWLNDCLATLDNRGDEQQL